MDKKMKLRIISSLFTRSSQKTYKTNSSLFKVTKNQINLHSFSKMVYMVILSLSLGASFNAMTKYLKKEKPNSSPSALYKEKDIFG